MLKQILHLLLFFCLVFCGNAQSTFPIHFNNITTEQGLSYNQIKTLYQDSYGFIWVGTNYGLNLYDGYEFKHFFYDTNDSTSISANQIRHIWEDSEKNIWIATTATTLNRYDRKKGVFERVALPKVEKNIISSFQDTRSDTVYIGMNKDGRLNYLDLKNETSSVLLEKEIQCKSPYPMGSIFKDSKGRIWFSDWQALYLYEPINGNIQCFKHDPSDKSSLSDRYVAAIYEDKKGQIWIGTPNGINLWNPSEQNFRRILPNDYLQGIKNPLLNYIGTFEEDAKGNLWLGTPDGLLYYDLSQDHFTAYESDSNGMLGGGVFCLIMDDNGVLWIGAGEGLGMLYPNARQFDRGIHDILVTNVKDAANSKQLLKANPEEYWLSTNIGLFQIKKQGDQVVRNKVGEKEFHGLYLAKDKTISAGTLLRGVFQYKNGKIEKHLASSLNEIQGSYIFDIAEDSEQALWVAANAGLNRYDPELEKYAYYHQKEFKTDEDISLSGVYVLHLDRKGNLWMGTGDQGLVFLSKQEIQKPFGTPLNFKVYVHDPNDFNSISGNHINYIHEAQNGAIWVGSENGLDLFDDGEFIRYQEGIAGNKVMSILEDDYGDLWIGTTAGLSHFNPQAEVFTNYYAADGLPSDGFIFGHCYKEENGNFIFGTEKGFISFQPEDLSYNDKIPPIYITDFKLFNKSVKVGEYDSLLQKSITLTKKIELKHDQNVLTFQFSALNYFDSERNEYAYQMIGFDDTLQYIGHRREVTFTNLDAGDYTFWVKASNNHDIWNKEGVKLQIRILPPWYRTWWAYLFWIAILIFSLYALYRFQLSRQLATAEAVRLKELDEVKTNLYTNITHEFRTPLTVILGMAKNIQTAPEKWSVEGSKLIERNGQNLLTLVNQMLDLSKLEAGKLEVNSVQSDLIAYLHYLVESFHSWAASKDIQLHFLPDLEELWMDFDAEKIQAIVSNLLSNAIKFTPAGGSIYLQVQAMKEAQVLLKVRDTGRGMTQEELKNIFDRFYQIDSDATREGEGTGIGLTLTKALIELLHGEIEVKSKLGKGSTFLVYLPIERTANLVETLEGKVVPTAIEQPTILSTNAIDDQLPLVLLVEDNQDVVTYLSSCLEQQYRLIIAYDGQEGIEKALEHSPDLIVSDVMMPKKNGFELCEVLKKHPQSSHIPIILLTAKADINSKIEGLTTGADAYLPKPFQEAELLVRLQKLLELRQQLKQYYTSSDFLNRPIPPTENQDEIFLHQLKTHIEEELDSPNLDVELLCKKMGLSRTAFYNKVNALVGTPPATYIRLVRLNYAKKLLLQTDLSITEIAYQCGFSSQSLFTRTFKAKEDVNPSQFRASR